MNESTETLPIASLRRDGGTQVRAGIDQERVAQYADSLAYLPPPVVFYDGETHWVGDGFHRIEAHIVKGREEIACIVREGDAFAAFLFGLGANREHDRGGLYRSNKDKRQAVEMLFAWLKKRGENWTDRRIAETCGVSNTFVSELRGQLSTDDTSTPAPRETAGGRKIKPRAATKAKKPSKGSAEPEAASGTRRTSLEPDPDQNAYLSIRAALRAATTRAGAERAYGAIAPAAENNELSADEVDELVAEYRQAQRRIESPQPDDGESPNVVAEDDGSTAHPCEPPPPRTSAVHELTPAVPADTTRVFDIVVRSLPLLEAGQLRILRASIDRLIAAKEAAEKEGDE